MLFLAACQEDRFLPDAIDHVGEITETSAPAASYKRSIYEMGTMDIHTEAGTAITSKESYVRCTVDVKAGLFMGDYHGTGRIKGRGNYSWGVYPKKPYRLKLDNNSSILGMAGNKDWALMADYRDPTHMMNMCAFAMAYYLDMPFTNHYRYVRLYINDVCYGLYMVTEHIEEGTSRVCINKDEGYLFNLDQNDGPDGSPGTGDNFYSQVYTTQVGIKYPKDPTADQVLKAQLDFAVMENAVKSCNWTQIQKYMDVRSAINEMIVQEVTQNIDFCNWRDYHSVPMYKVDNDSPWAWGPVWDFDSGFSLDVDRHNYQAFFVEYKKLILGSDPYLGTNCYCGRIPGLMSDLFYIPEFVQMFKQVWADNKDGMLAYTLSEIDKIHEVIREAAYEDFDIWGISAYMDYDTQIEKMKEWLVNRFDYLDRIIPHYAERNK